MKALIRPGDCMGFLKVFVGHIGHIICFDQITQKYSVNIQRLKYGSAIRWALSRETLNLVHAHNKGSDQPAHPRSLISAFVASFL